MTAVQQVAQIKLIRVQVIIDHKGLSPFVFPGLCDLLASGQAPPEAVPLAK